MEKKTPVLAVKWKKTAKNLVVSKKVCTFASAFTKMVPWPSVETPIAQKSWWAHHSLLTYSVPWPSVETPHARKSWCKYHSLLTYSVPWMSGLVNGLQNRLRRFESARHLERFSKKSGENIWWLAKKCVPLHSLRKKDGSLAQLNRASDYGSEGCGFESRGSHKEEVITTSFFVSPTLTPKQPNN